MLTMLILLFCISLFGSIASVALTGPITRVLQERVGLSEKYDRLVAAREALAAAQAARVASHARVRALDLKIDEVDNRSNALTRRLARIPLNEWEVIFELGQPEPGAQVFEFFVTRSIREDAPTLIRPGEGALFATGRRVRCWSRTEVGAVTLATGRFSSHDGYMLRLAAPGTTDPAPAVATSAAAEPAVAMSHV
jgi:hypothetical protein